VSNFFMASPWHAVNVSRTSIMRSSCVQSMGDQALARMGCTYNRARCPRT